MFANINYNIQELVKRECPALKDWNVGKIDKEFTSNIRQSVCFNSKLQTVRLKFFERLPNKEEFAKIWMEKYAEWTAYNKFSKKPTEEEKETCIHMDYIFYRALLMCIYKVKTAQ